MKSSLVLKACLILVAAFTLSACGAKDEKKSAPAAAKPPAATDANDKDQKAELTGLCSDEIIQLLNAVDSKAETIATEKSRDNLVLIDKACENFKEKIGNTVCLVEDKKSDERTAVNKDSSKKVCDAVTSALKPAVVQPKVEEKKEQGKEQSKKIETKKEESTAEKAKKKAELEKAAKKIVETPELTKAKEVAATEKQLSTYAGKLKLKINRVDIFQAILKDMDTIQEGLAVAEGPAVDAKKPLCHLDGTDFGHVFTQNEIIDISSIEMDNRDGKKTNIVLSNNSSGTNKVVINCLKAKATPNPTTSWTLKDVQGVLGDAAELHAN